MNGWSQSVSPCRVSLRHYPLSQREARGAESWGPCGVPEEPASTRCPIKMKKKKKVKKKVEEDGDCIVLDTLSSSYQSRFPGIWESLEAWQNRQGEKMLCECPTPRKPGSPVPWYLSFSPINETRSVPSWPDAEKVAGGIHTMHPDCWANWVVQWGPLNQKKRARKPNCTTWIVSHIIQQAI